MKQYENPSVGRRVVPWFSQFLEYNGKRVGWATISKVGPMHIMQNLTI